MNSKEFSLLEDAIKEWLDKAITESDGVGEDNTIIGDRTVELMATAARSVFDACEESQSYGRREGYFDTK